jgi:diguanylate cyclase (GGDEF)-like protein
VDGRRSERGRGGDSVGLQRACFGLHPEDEASLDRIRFAVREEIAELVACFYEHPVTQPGSHTPPSLDALRASQRAYLSTLGLYSDTEEYVEGRTRIALLHAAAGLDRAWYIGAHARLFRPIARQLAGHYADADRLLPLLVTLQRILAFDAYLVGEGYLRATSHRLERRLEELSESQHRVLEGSRRDGLTQIDSRAYLLQALESEVGRSRREQRAFSLLFIDVDHFKTVNDTFGHAAGDEALRGIVEVLKSSLRPGDVVGRYGGDEFLVGLVHASEAKAARVASRICRRVMAYSRKGTAVTVSIGCATLSADDSVASLIRRADTAMYEAKAAGRNRVSSPVATVREGRLPRPPPPKTESGPRHAVSSAASRG